MRLTLVTSACCQGKEDEEKKQLMENELEMEFGCVENLEVRAQSLCKTSLVPNMQHVQGIYSAHMGLSDDDMQQITVPVY